MRVALLLCPSWDQEYPTYAVALLSAELKRKGHEPCVFDLNKDFFLHDSKTESDPVAAKTMAWLRPGFVRERVLGAFGPYFDSYADSILASGARVAGFSVVESNEHMSLALAALLKRRDPSLKVVFGGPMCFKPYACKRYAAATEVDAVVVGEGDRAFAELVAAYEAGADPRGVPGVLIHGDGRFPERLDFPPPADLDDSPVPDFGGFRLDDYPAGYLTLETTRGCVRRCVFCDDWRRWKKFRQKGAARIAGQMAELARRHPRSKGFFFSDSIVNGDLRQLTALADALIGEGPKTEWAGYAIVRPEMTLPYMEKLRRSGCTNLLFGVETGSDKISRDMGKNIGRDLNARVLGDSRRAGLFNVTFIFVGFPTETDDDFQQTLDFIGANATSIGLLHASMCTIGDMRADLGRYGMHENAHAMFWKTADGRNDFMVRLGRFRRVLDLAEDLGIRTAYYLKGGGSTVGSYCDTLLSEYKGHLLSAAAQRGVATA